MHTKQIATVVLGVALSAVSLVLLVPPSWADAPPPTGDVTGVVTVMKDGAPKEDRRGVVVYLERVPGGSPDGTERHAAVDQRNLTFSPEVTVVVKGTIVDFPNNDKVFHNVFSVSEAATFDLGLYKAGTSKTVVVKRAGTVDVYCNIHPEMFAKIKVLDTLFYAITKKDGGFTIPGVPPGTYPVVGWQPFGKAWRGQVEVTPSGKASVAIELTEGERVVDHSRKDGTPYGRYK